ncbi:hypothetical protein SO802_026512 [Lithocarpus litseifolius]|uniref:Reverse transcriptase zinc-binding domain-containing protein n=1 Tax=Lithocarpus litseifolius TaxID=425828 RepID=A0AAW2C0A0_9ROSI
MDPGNGSETTLTECASFQSFQAKLDETDGELSRFDQMEDGSVSLQGGVGSRMMGSALFLKNLFTQEKSSSPIPFPSKFTRIPRKSSMVLDPLGVVLSKRSRQEEVGVLEEGSERCKKRAREVVNMGAIWRIGNGEKVKVWDHQWLPVPGCGRIISPRAGSVVDKVSELFYPNSRVWDPGKLAACFLPWEAEKVKGIYVGEDDVEDVLIWPLSSSGNYSVRSAYRMLMEAENFVLPSSSSPLSEHNIWKKIWKLKVPKKVCHFLWRAAKDSLPTKQNLRLRHIPLDDTCEGCNDHSESLLHCLWLCDQARFVWMSDPGFLFLTQKKCRSFLEVLESLFSAGSSFQCAQFAMTAWCLWESRNRLRVHQHTWQLHEIGVKALELVQEFWDIHCKEASSIVRPPRVRWTPPPTPCYKLNFDAALLDGFNQVGLGVVCRDSQGYVLAALSQKVGPVQSVEMAEALGARRAVVFPRELSFFDVQIEGDCLRIIQALQVSDRCYTLYGHILDETKRLSGLLRAMSFSAC